MTEDTSRQVESFSFELDDDLVKVISVTRDGRTCRVNVRFGRDVLLHEENHVFELDGPIEITRHDRSISIRSSKRFLGLFNRRLTRRF